MYNTAFIVIPIHVPSNRHIVFYISASPFLSLKILLFVLFLSMEDIQRFSSMHLSILRGFSTSSSTPFFKFCIIYILTLHTLSHHNIAHREWEKEPHATMYVMWMSHLELLVSENAMEYLLAHVLIHVDSLSAAPIAYRLSSGPFTFVLYGLWCPCRSHYSRSHQLLHRGQFNHLGAING